MRRCCAVPGLGSRSWRVVVGGKYVPPLAPACQAASTQSSNEQLDAQASTKTAPAPCFHAKQPGKRNWKRASLLRTSQKRITPLLLPPDNKPPPISLPSPPSPVQLPIRQALYNTLRHRDCWSPFPGIVFLRTPERALSLQSFHAFRRTCLVAHRSSHNHQPLGVSSTTCVAPIIRPDLDRPLLASFFPPPHHDRLPPPLDDSSRPHQRPSSHRRRRAFHVIDRESWRRFLSSSPSC